MGCLLPGLKCAHVLRGMWDSIASPVLLDTATAHPMEVLSLPASPVTATPMLRFVILRQVSHADVKCLTTQQSLILF